MIEENRSFYAEIDALADAVEGLSARGTCAVFGVCGKALSPLLRQVEQRDQGNWAVPDLTVAQDVIESFATGRSGPENHQELSDLLMVKVPGDHPWSTYGQDVLICTRAALAAASTGDRPKSIVIQYTLEPLMAFMEDRDADLIRQRGDTYWSAQIVRDPVMAAAVKFVRKLIVKASQNATISSGDFLDLIEDGAILRP